MPHYRSILNKSSVGTASGPFKPFALGTFEFSLVESVQASSLTCWCKYSPQNELACDREHSMYINQSTGEQRQAFRDNSRQECHCHKIKRSKCQ